MERVYFNPYVTHEEGDEVLGSQVRSDRDSVRFKLNQVSLIAGVSELISDQSHYKSVSLETGPASIEMEEAGAGGTGEDLD